MNDIFDDLTTTETPPTKGKNKMTIHLQDLLVNNEFKKDLDELLDQMADVTKGEQTTAKTTCIAPR
jgi:hypothetical protein